VRGKTWKGDELAINTSAVVMEFGKFFVNVSFFAGSYDITPWVQA
jgi:hypothetical protein